MIPLKNTIQSKAYPGLGDKFCNSRVTKLAPCPYSGKCRTRYNNFKLCGGFYRTFAGEGRTICLFKVKADGKTLRHGERDEIF